VDPDIDVDTLASCVLNDIVHSFFEDEEDLAPDIGAEHELASERGTREAEVDVFSRQGIAGKVAHALEQVADAVALRVDGPDDVAHRLDELARDRGDAAKGVRRLQSRVGVTADELAKNGDLREAGADVVVEIGSDSRPDALDGEKLRDAVAMEERPEPGQ